MPRNLARLGLSVLALLATLPSLFAADAWLTDLEAAKKQAAAEKKDARAELEALADDVRKALRAAIAKAEPSLSTETIEKITDAMEDKLKEKAKEAGAGKKGADAKTPAKPFPFGDKAKTEEKKPEAAPAAK